LVDRILEETGVHPPRLILEITGIDDRWKCRTDLHVTVDAPALVLVGLHVDDSCTGYSLSLLSFNWFPPHCSGKSTAHSVNTITKFEFLVVMRTLPGLKPQSGDCHEGVETPFQVGEAEIAGCGNTRRGYYYSRPMYAPPRSSSRVVETSQRVAASCVPKTGVPARNFALRRTSLRTLEMHSSGSPSRLGQWNLQDPT